MNPIWLVLIVPSSAFLGVMLMAAVSIRATNDFQAAIARRDKMIKELENDLDQLREDRPKASW